MSLNTILGAVGIGSSIFSTILGANAANNAANTQAGAANNAASLAATSANNALDFQKQIFNTQLGLSLPGIATGQGALSQLAYLLGIPVPGLNVAPAGSSTVGVPGNASPSAPGSGSGALSGGVAPGVGAFPGAGVGVNPNGSNGPSGGSSTPYYYNPFANGTGTDIPTPGAGTPYFNPQGADLRQNRTDNQDARNPADVDPGVRTRGSSTNNIANINTLLNGAPASTNAVPGGGFGSLMQGFNEKFVAPTAATEQNDPGYAFRRDEGQKLIERSAAARGNLLTGGTAKAEQRYGQDYASGEYGKVYDRSLGEYLNRFNISNTNDTNKFNRLAAIANLGQVQNTTLANAGQSAANNTSNTLLTSAGQIGNDLNNAGAARASGYVGTANAVTGGLNNIAQLLLLLKGGGSQPSSTSNTNPWGGMTF